MEQEFKITDTSKLQLSSVKKFMKQLGYEYFSKDNAFYCGYTTAKARSWISLRTAILAHNGNFTETHGRGFEPDTVFANISYDMWKAANEAKIVRFAYLQHYKKGNYIKCQKHLVKFVNQEDASLFIK